MIRHGQTEWNITGRIQGKTDIPLNAIGLHQGRLLSKAMEKHSVSAVYASPLKRAYETALLLAVPGGLLVSTLKELCEVDFGLWEGLTWEEINKLYPDDFKAWDENPVRNTPTGGERKESSKGRCRKAMEHILKRETGDVAIVAHGGILVFVADYLLRSQKDRNEVIVRNASITTIEYDRETERGTLISLNDVSHLAELKDGKTNKYY